MKATRTPADVGRRRGNRQSGFTLIEIVVAMVVTVLTLGLAAGAFRLLSHSGERGDRLLARHDSLARGIDVLRRDIERLERVTTQRDDGRALVFLGDSSHLTFVAVEPPFPTEPGPYFIAYAIRQGRDGATLTRERAPFQRSAIDLSRLRTGDSAAVIEGPYAMRFLYLERTKGRERWLTQWTDPVDPPSLIGLEITGVADGATVLPLLTFRPRIDAEAGCVRERGACNF
ncbi:MAG: prepilin-type N-terminal cleavage/methylation domain-containing protein [Hyphomicrobiaceae bacterium]|nr:prepilin-type N-terminal cleavage/methylation domain-containing protein [Hyphomicrobiaceae bacterium]